MAPEILASIAGILLSLLFSYMPGFANWYVPLSGNLKRAIMIVLLIMASAGAYFLTCAGVTQVPLSCDEAGIYALLRAFVDAVIANQAAYLISPRRK